MTGILTTRPGCQIAWGVMWRTIRDKFTAAAGFATWKQMWSREDILDYICSILPPQLCSQTTSYCVPKSSHINRRFNFDTSYPSHPLGLGTSRVDESRCISCETFCTWQRASAVSSGIRDKIHLTACKTLTRQISAVPPSWHATMPPPLSTSPSLWSNSDLCCLSRQSYN